MSNRFEMPFLLQPHTRKVHEESAELGQRQIYQEILSLTRQQLAILRKAGARNVPLYTSDEIAEMGRLDWQIAKLKAELRKM